MPGKFSEFSDDEMIVMDCALTDDVSEGDWHDEEKEKALVILLTQVRQEIEKRNLIPED